MQRKAGLSNLHRISLGLLLSTIGMGAAAVLELKRRSVITKSTSVTPLLPVSVFLLIPQFFISGCRGSFHLHRTVRFLHHRGNKRDGTAKHWAFSCYNLSWILR